MLHLLLAAALAAAPALAAPNPAPVIAADRAFSAMAKAEGPTKAFDAYLVDDVVGVAGGYVFGGKSEFLGEFTSAPPGFVLEWGPTGGAISDDGTLGSTWGDWTRRRPGADGKFTTTQGSYFTVWRKAAGGRWQVIVDGGSTRAPVKKP